MAAKKRKKKRSKKSKKFWIQKALKGKHRGALHRALGIPLGKAITASQLKKAEQRGGKIAKEAYLAETLKRMHKR